MRTALVLLSVLLLQAAGGGVLHQPLHPAATGQSGGVTRPADTGQPDVTGVTARSARAAEDALINRVAFLTLDPPSRERLASQSINAAAAVSIGRDDAAARLDAYAFEERLNRTGNPEAVIAAELDAVEGDLDDLRKAGRTLRRRYVNGSIRAARFVRKIAHLQARAVRLRVRLSGIREAIDRRAGEPFLARVNGLEHELLGLGGPRREQALAGPVRKRALAALRGTRGRVDLYAAASEHGFVFAAVTGSGYVRETYRADHHRSSRASFNLTQAAERARDLYPIAFDVDFSLGYGITGLGRGRYLIRSDLPFGSLSSYLDGNTRTVFFEIQRRSLGRIDQPASVTASANGTRLIVNRSYPGGPLRVAVVDHATGTPVESAVRVDEKRLRTGSDGVVWTLTPPKVTFAVRAIRPSGNVTTSVRPIDLRPINESS